MSHLARSTGYTILFLAGSPYFIRGRAFMSSPFDFDSRIDELLRIINSLRDLEDALKMIVEQFESLSVRMPFRPEEDSAQEEWSPDMHRLKKRDDKDEVILISDKRMSLISKEDLPRALRSNLNRLMEYKIDTAEEMSALEKLLSTLEKKKKMGK